MQIISSPETQEIKEKKLEDMRCFEVFFVSLLAFSSPPTLVGVGFGVFLSEICLCFHVFSFIFCFHGFHLIHVCFIFFIF